MLQTFLFFIGGVFIKHLSTEEFVRDLYKQMKITKPEQLDIDYICKMLKLKVYYGSSSFNMDGNICIKRSSLEEEWQDFGHEVGHHFKHVGNQITMHYLFRDLQEYQADHFAYHFCIPTFMLLELPSIDSDNICRTFNVSKKFAEKRIYMYQNKILERVQGYV